MTRLQDCKRQVDDLQKQHLTEKNQIAHDFIHDLNDKDEKLDMVTMENAHLREELAKQRELLASTVAEKDHIISKLRKLESIYKYAILKQLTK